jgi:hypothetical protein
MDSDKLRRLRRETSALGPGDVQRPLPSTRIVTPSVTRQPVLDSSLGRMTHIAQYVLQKLDDKVADGRMLDTDELRQFKSICELVLQQTRVEMEVERHVAQRHSSMTQDQIRSAIEGALSARRVEPQIVHTVLEALGLL